MTKTENKCGKMAKENGKLFVKNVALRVETKIEIKINQLSTVDVIRRRPTLVAIHLLLIIMEKNGA